MIVCDAVHKSYPLGHGRKKVLDGIDLVIRPGERIGFLGRNGAGKTTLIKLIGAVEYPTAGRINRGMTVSWPLGRDADQRHGAARHERVVAARFRRRLPGQLDGL